MNSIIQFSLCFLLFFLACSGDDGIPSQPITPGNPNTNDNVDLDNGFMSPMSYNGMELIWSDEFDGNSLDLTKWDYDIGTGCPDLCGWGNNELQYYRSQNVSVGSGVVTFTAQREDFQSNQYTSGKIVTRNIQSFQYGRLDIRALMPAGGQGMWPALWLLGINQPTVGWPACGEIDVMEMIGGRNRENQISGNVFWEDGGVREAPSTYQLSGKTFFDEYHVFSIEWVENEILWYVNDELYKSFNTNGVAKDEFRLPFYFIMNLAVGGNFPGNPDNTTSLPSQMKVDYVRFFQKI